MPLSPTFLIGAVSLLVLLTSALFNPLRKLFPFFVATGLILLVVLGLTNKPNGTLAQHSPRSQVTRRISAPASSFPASVRRFPAPSVQYQQLDLIAQSQGFNNHAHKVEHFRLARLWGLPTWYGMPN
jgi:hypothetical protein